MIIPANPIRKSVPNDDLIRWFEAGWAYVMPDFDRPDFYVIEWLSDKPGVEPSLVSENHRVSESTKEAAEG